MKNSTKQRLRVIGERAFHTFWQTLLPLIPVGAMITELDWLNILEICLTASILSIVKSLALGVPEDKPITDISDEAKEFLSENSEEVQ